MEYAIIDIYDLTLSKFESYLKDSAFIALTKRLCENIGNEFVKTQSELEKEK